MSEQRPVYNLSSRALSLAQRIDMLPPGEYTMRLVKPDVSGMSWHVEIVRVETLCVVELPQKIYQME